jgi:4-amino-4-deoxy-L-arabinose transferase-like glycosyltransferase
MTEPTPLAKAEAAVRHAETDTVAVQLALAAVELAKAATAQQQPAQQAAPQQQFDSKKWLTIGGLAIVGGLVASLFAVAVAIGAVSVAILALVLRAMWRDFQKHR